MKELVIIGAGRFGREVHAWAQQSLGHASEWRIKGFLDSRTSVLDGFPGLAPIVGTPEDYLPSAGELFICAVGDPAAKQRYCELLLARGAVFTNLIHHSAVLSPDAHLGRGIILCPYVVVSTNATVGDFVTVNMHSFLAHDARVGAYAQIHGHVSINGAVVLGAGVTIGSNATVLPEMSVGDFATVGAGSVVLQKVPPGQTVFGNPARPLGLPPRASATPHAPAPGAPRSP